MYTAIFAYDLGDRVKDKITGVVGIIVSRTQHLYGCTRYWVQPEAVKDGKPVEGAWYDEPGLSMIMAGAHQSHNVVTAAQKPVEPAQRGHGFDLPDSRRS